MPSPKNAMTYLERAIKDGHARFVTKNNMQYVEYMAANHLERFSDPEEYVRSEFWAELIYVYHYEPTHIGVEITVPDRTPRDAADLVVFRDFERKRPYAIIECKRDGISDAEFNQAVEQACGNGTWAKFQASFVGVVAGNTRRLANSGLGGMLRRPYSPLVRDRPVIQSRRLGIRPSAPTHLRDGATAGIASGDCPSATLLAVRYHGPFCVPTACVWGRRTLCIGSRRPPMRIFGDCGGYYAARI
jgi:hypothetical protein